MKKFSRLTALLLAITMLVTSMPLMALADSITVDIDTWNSWVEEAQNAAANQTETVTTTVPVTGETSVVDRPVVEAALTAHAGTETSATQAATLPIAGKLVLKAFDGASSYQWQVKAGSQWANIVGDKGATVTLTYAKVQNAISGGAAQVRCVMVVDGQDYVSATAQVTVDETVTYTTVETESTLTVTAEVPVRSNYALRSSGAATYNDTDTPRTYNVVINYVFENGTVAGDPYTANLAEGSSFGATVTFPVVQGYLAYFGENAEASTSYDLNISNIQEDITYTVTYKPTNVNYTVIHYKQNLDDDKYTEADRETLQGLTKSEVPEVKKNYEGFYALLYEHPAIAADGSTVVEVYYDRYYYLMNFDLDGGYGVEPIYARYGTSIGNVGTPTKAGYSFGGWSLNGEEKDLPSTMPAGNQTYKAIWTPDATAKVTVVFWGENADDEGYSYIKSAQVNVKPGTEFTYNESGSLVCGQEEHTHDASCGYACNQQEHFHDEECYTFTCKLEEHTHSESCYNCGLESHTHGTDCYTGVGSPFSASYKEHRVNGTESNGSIGQSQYWLGTWNDTGKKYIYINGTWYRYTGTTAIGGVAPTTCGKTEGNHTHTDACLGCGKEEHTHSGYTGSCYTLNCTTPEHNHSDACGYNCGKIAHTHNDDCYMSGAGLDSNLWKFVRSDTVTVAADGSSVVNVYYDRAEKTLTFKYNYSDRNYQSTETITAKWGANISEQYKKIAANAGSTFWSAKTSGNEPYTNYFGVMPQASATYYNRGRTGSEGTMTYWGQDLNGEYTVKLFEVTGVGGYSVSDEDRYEFQGFTYHHGTSNNSTCIGAAFYYTRNSYTLTFNDGYKDVKTESVKYQAPLSTYAEYVPAVPSAYEPGSVKFGGWYLNPECSGAEYKLNEHKMPADNVLLYAKWVPVTHKVQFYLDKAALDAGTKLSTHPDITVPHGTKADPTPANPTNGSYTFVGWFYMENGVEKAFDFANMPVNKDLQVYGKWSSNVLKEYTILYKYKDSEGNEIEIADPTKGSGLAGITKTFEAKGGTDLYADYQEGYFPVTKSHSMTIDIEDTSKNIYTFEYVAVPAVPYTVYYVTTAEDAVGNKITLDGVEYTMVATTKQVNDNHKAVVTEQFAAVSGYLPDAYQKRLVVSVDENGNPDTEHNVIIFYYTKDTTHAYYKITHYTENLAKDSQGNTTWTEYASSQAVGDIGTIYTATDMTIPGFTYDSTVPGTVVSGKLTADGLELKLYYTRNSYPYQVRYLEQGSGNELHTPKDGTGKYGQVISESAIAITNYTAVDQTPQTLNIRIEESQTEAKLNIITFYYTENEATINYKVVGPEGCGTVSPTSETLKVLSGTAQGSTATATSNVYKFVGWYANEACSGEPISTNAKYVPIKADGAAWLDGTTYYAKFEYNLTTLTIKKNIVGRVENDACFVFKVTGGGLDMNVAIQGNGSVTIDGLTVGTKYTVQEISGNWRYTLDTKSNEITLDPDANKNVVTITNTRKTDQWLDDNAYCENVFTTVADGAGD